MLLYYKIDMASALGSLFPCAEYKEGEANYFIVFHRISQQWNRSMNFLRDTLNIFLLDSK